MRFRSNAKILDFLNPKNKNVESKLYNIQEKELILLLIINYFDENREILYPRNLIPLR